MFKRVLLALTFVAALSAAGLASSKATAHGCGYGGGGYGYRAAYYPTYAAYDYYPTVSYYRPAYPAYYGGGYGHRHHHHHHHGRGGVTIGFGF